MKVTSYDVFLDLDFKNLSFKGKVLMSLETENDVALNALGISIERVSSENKTLEFTHDDDGLRIKTGPFNRTLLVEYSGAIPDTLVGIYRASYDHDYIVTTQFEAAHARRMFPCVDHPAYKAEFRLSVRIDQDLDAISNMPVASVKPEGEKKTVTFQMTPRMSTYLLYLGIGKFEEIKDRFANIDFIVATVPGKVRKGVFSLNIAKRCIDFYQTYFNIPYILPKLHLICIPEFAAGAMENWGAISFRETALLIDDNSSVRAKKRVGEIVAHEIAHMWFGDLTTMKWWNDLWLNESFATFICHKALETINPEWNTWRDFLRNTMSAAMSRDSLRNTHPIDVHVEEPEEIEQVFDDISYGKGASILRMIEAYMGSSDFREGLRDFLSRYQFSNATGDDLWGILENKSGKQIKRIMSEWIRKAGYPLITVSNNEGKLTVRQERFSLSGEVQEEIWPVPLTVVSGGAVTQLLLDKREETIYTDNLESIKLNLDRIGFYRVYYKGLYEMVWKSDLSVYDKWGIISDAFAFLFAGKMSFSEYLGLAERYRGEQDYLLVLEVSDQLALLYSIMSERIAEFSKAFHSSQLAQLQGKNDENSSMLRGIIATRLALVDDDYSKELGLRFHEPKETEPDMKDAIAVAYARSYNALEEILREYRKSEFDEDRVRLLGALTCFKEDSLTALSLGLAFTGEVKKQDVSVMLLSAVRNPNAREITWNWLKINFEKLREFYGGTGNLSRMLLSVIPILGIGKVEEVKRFFVENRMPEAEKGIEAGLEKLEVYNRLTKSL